MTKKYFNFIFVFSFLFGFAQPKLQLKGKIMYENFPLQKIEIINLDTEKIVFSNADGYFEIELKIGNTLVVGNQAYNYQTLKIKKEDTENPDFKIVLIKKIEELEEVVISNVKMQKIGLNQGELDKIRLQKANTFPNNINNQNQIPNGANLIAIGQLFGKLFKSIFNIQSKKIEKIVPPVDIQSYIEKNFKPNYLIDTLELKPEEIQLFFEFCKLDAAYKTTFESDNVLIIMDFLTKKRTAFKMIPR